MKEPASQEYLHAFVDGELAADERELALQRLEDDPHFKAQVCELHALKERVRGAYAELPVCPAGNRLRPRSSMWRQALAAGLLLALGISAGWVGREAVEPSPPSFERLVGLPSGYQAVALADRVNPDKIVLHLDSSDPQRLMAVLDLAERLLQARAGKGVVEVVANSYGLSLLRTDTSPFRERIGQLSEHYAGLDFVACGQSVARLRREGVAVELLPQVHVASSAIGEILDRMRQGWVYVKV